MTFEPKPGLVIRYDFLWKEDDRAGVTSGKDRPCAVVLILDEREDGARRVLLCAITHSPPVAGETAVELPVAVCRHLGFDDERSWIKTEQVNLLIWPKDRIPYGVQPVARDRWFYGMLPQAIGRQVFEQVREKARQRRLRSVDRDS